jgi:hypothetical protein
LDWMIGFVAPYAFTELGTTDNTELSLFYTYILSEFTTTQAIRFSVFTSRILAMNL